MAGGHGGRRPGSGGKPGNANRIKIKIAQEVAEAAKAQFRELIDDDEINDMDPLTVMLLGMKMAMKEGNIELAVNRAAMCAPYIVPRLSSVESKVTTESNIKNIPDEKLDAVLARVDAEQSERSFESKLN